MRVAMYFDYSSPFAYLGSTQIERVAGPHGVEPKPFLLGALFRSIGTPMVPLDAMPAPKRRYQRAELDRWAAHWGVPFHFASRFPVRTVDALRLTLLAPPDARFALVHALMRATWVDDRDPADHAVLRDAAREAGLDAALVERTGEARDALRAATDDAIARGVPGAPTFAVDGRLFWGQDRLDFVGRALAGWRPAFERPNLSDIPEAQET